MNPFDRAVIGRTGVSVTRLGLGTGWPASLAAAPAQATIRRAWDVGLRYFDTAPFYGYGASERHIQSALEEVDRAAFTVSTKVGRLIRSAPGTADDGSSLEAVFDFSESGIRESLSESRGRLGFDRIDIALIHDPDHHHNQASRESYKALAELRDRGEIGAIGVGMNSSAPLTAFATEIDIDCVLLAGRYSLLEQGALDDLVPVLSERHISMVAGGVFNSGVLVDASPESTYNYGAVPRDVLAKAKRLREACAHFDVPLRAAAIQFPFALPVVATVIVGAQSPAEVDDNLAMVRHPIPTDLWKRLKEDELIRPDAPVPIA